MRMKWSGLVAALALTVAACTPSQVQPDTSQASAQPAQGMAFTVAVTNSMDMPMNVSYRYGGDTVTALGTIPAGQTMTFTVPNRGSDNLEVMAADANGGNIVRKKLDMASGMTVSWTLKTP